MAEIKDCYVLCTKLETHLSKHKNICKEFRKILTKVAKHKETVADKKYQENKILRTNNRQENIVVDKEEKCDNLVVKEKNNVNRVAKCDEKDINGGDKDIDMKTVVSNGDEHKGEEKPVSNDNSENVDTEEDDKSDSGEKKFNEGILCPHGNLTVDKSLVRVVPVRVWEILSYYFPNAPVFPYDAEPCHECQSQASENEVMKDIYHEKATVQKRELQDLFLLRNRPQPGRTPHVMYIVPRDDFYDPWRAFIRVAGRREMPSDQEIMCTLRVSTLTCSHGLLMYSPHDINDSEKLVYVTEPEWETLKTYYSADGEITVNKEMVTNPPLCDSCYASRLEHEQKESLRYDRAKIFIRLVSNTQVAEESEWITPANTTKRPRLAENVTGAAAQTTAAAGGPTAAAAQASVSNLDIRRSTRIRKVRGEKEAVVSSDLTLRQLKLKIMELFSVPPFDQHLSMACGRELVDNESTLYDLGIYPSSVLLLKVDEPSTDANTFDDYIKSSEPEAGFKGTELLGRL